MTGQNIAIVDDQEMMRESLKETLLRAGYAVRAFASGEAALADLERASADMVITDMKMPSMSGIELLERVLRLAPETPVAVITAHGTVETAVEAMKKGAFDYILKPFSADAIELVVAKALRHRRLKAENEFLRGEMAGARGPAFVGESPAAGRVLEMVRRVAGSTSTVLIRGESGTGKEIVAAMIHAAGPRAGAPFIKVNCAALSAGLLESELFGHEKGAFTGADRARAGRFELADGGTILLDEVSEMDLALQGKLLRVLQEREFERVGSSETRRVDVRIIATSNRNLEKCIEDGSFRRDLFYRLNVVPILVPPLRERRDDIPLLAGHFLAKHAHLAAGALREISHEALGRLAAYDWPGNVRELENIVERAIVLSTGPTIGPEHVAAGLPESLPGAATDPDQSATLPQMEREMILKTLKRLGGHREKTAEALGIAVRTLRDKLKRYKEEGVNIGC